MGKDEPMVVI